MTPRPMANGDCPNWASRPSAMATCVMGMSCTAESTLAWQFGLAMNWSRRRRVSRRILTG